MARHRQRVGPVTGGTPSFPGQRWVIVPRDVVRSQRRRPLLRALLPTAAGAFPRAGGHWVRRPAGVPEWIVISCLSGRGWLELARRRVNVVAGEIVFIPPLAAHAYGADQDDPWSIVWAHAVGGDLPAFVRGLGLTHARPKLRLSGDIAAQRDFHRVYEVLEQGYGGAQLVASASALRLVLAEMLRARRESGRPEMVTGDAVARASEWMRRNLAARTTLAELGRHAGASPSHLSALFRRRVGYPPMDYFTRLKIQHACRLLDTTGAPIKDVAAALGQQDPYYFSRQFRQIMGMSPRAYRALARG